MPVFCLVTIFTYLPCLRYFFNKHKEALIKAHKIKTQKKFLKRCLDERIVPRSLLSNKFRNQSQSPLGRMEEEIIRRAISSSERETEEAFAHSRSTLRRLKSACSDNGVLNVFRFLCDKAIQMCNSQISKKKYGKWYKYSREDSVVNLSNFNLTSHMKCILGYVLSFSLPSTSNSIIKFLTDFSFFIYAGKFKHFESLYSQFSHILL